MWGGPSQVDFFDPKPLLNANDGQDLSGQSVGINTKSLGRVLGSHFREEDVRGRWGGDEFSVCLYGLGAEAARPVLERALDEFSRQTFRSDEGERFQARFTAGIASFPASGAALDDLFRAADERLLRAKEAGGDRIVC